MVAVMGVLCLVGMANANLVEIPMDAQINMGMPGTDQSPSGDAIYEPVTFGVGAISFESEPAGGFTRFHKLLGPTGPEWYYMYVDLWLAGLGEVDITGQTLMVDARVFDDPDTNTNPYGDTNFFARVYTYDINPDTGARELYAGHRDYGIVYGPNDTVFPFGDWNNWNTTMVDLDGGSNAGAFDPTRVSRVRFYGTNWAGAGNDTGDFKNLVITPEPASLALLALGGLALLRRR
jgi:hypothetical protein